MSRATKKYNQVGEVKPKAKALRHFKVEAVEKLMTNFQSCLNLSVQDSTKYFKTRTNVKIMIYLY